VSQRITRQQKALLFLSVVTLGELRKGAVLLPPGKKRSGLEESIASLIPSWFSARILPVTQAIAERWGVLEGECRLRGASLNTADGMIAATALEHGLTLVTRNVKDFVALGVLLLNPWDAP
jgi:predicted nucleic acid-binding protein